MKTIAFIIFFIFVLSTVDAKVRTVVFLSVTHSDKKNAYTYRNDTLTEPVTISYCLQHVTPMVTLPQKLSLAIPYRATEYERGGLITNTEYLKKHPETSKVDIGLESWTYTRTYDDVGRLELYEFTSCLACKSKSFKYNIGHNENGQINMITNGLYNPTSIVGNYLFLSTERTDTKNWSIQYDSKGRPSIIMVTTGADKYLSMFKFTYNEI